MTYHNLVTSLPKVIWEEGRVAAANVSTHWLQWHAPNLPPKVPLPVDRSPNPTTCLIHGPSDLLCQTVSRSDPPFFSTMHWTDRRIDRPTDCPRESLMTSPLRL